MSYKVLVVDDSSFFRRRVSEILNSDKNLTVVDVAVNGIEAVEKAKLLKPDVITMDIEMPLLNGIDAVKQIMATTPTSILMFSSLTHQGAKATLDALEAGALDFLPKKFNEIAKTTEDAGRLLIERVVHLARHKEEQIGLLNVNKMSANTAELTNPESRDKPKPSTDSTVRQANHLKSDYRLLAVGTSTGGPIALQKVLAQLPADFPVPIVLIQHMPATFTKAFASRLNSLCKVTVKEAENGDILKSGCAYLAPGGKQMLIDGSLSAAKLLIREDLSDKVSFKPSVDITFATAAKVFNKHVLGVILTGMGSDGMKGAKILKDKGSTIWSQDEASCVVYGMPQAVENAGISVKAIALSDMSCSILKEVTHG